jgi:hypothetical protein
VYNTKDSESIHRSPTLGLIGAVFPKKNPPPLPVPVAVTVMVTALPTALAVMPAPTKLKLVTLLASKLLSS